MTAITRNDLRRENDFYATPGGAAQILVDRINISGNLLECCAGANDITQVLRTIPNSIVTTNDIDHRRNTDFNLDLSTPIGWMMMDIKPDWIVTNPPFKHAPELVPLAYEKATIGIAMLLRLSFLEPCHNRSKFLVKYPPTSLIVLPRISFTGDGKTDSTTCAWMIWDKRATGQTIEIVGGTIA